MACPHIPTTCSNHLPNEQLVPRPQPIIRNRLECRGGTCCSFGAASRSSQIRHSRPRLTEKEEAIDSRVVDKPPSVTALGEPCQQRPLPDKLSCAKRMIAHYSANFPATWRTESGNGAPCSFSLQHRLAIPRHLYSELALPRVGLAALRHLRRQPQQPVRGPDHVGRRLAQQPPPLPKLGQSRLFLVGNRRELLPDQGAGLGPACLGHSQTIC